MARSSRRRDAARPWQRHGDSVDVDALLAAPAPAPRLPGYEVRRVDPARAVKDYRCPGCGNTVPAGEGHVVVWPDGAADLRRHWHAHCWRHEVRRTAGA